MRKTNKFEGADILALMNAANDESDIVCDELTKGRIRVIYIQLKYGSKKAYEVAEYYNLPVQLIKDIRDGKIFRNITSESYIEPKK